MSNTLKAVAPKHLFVAGLVLLLLGLAAPAGVQLWLDSRTAEPVDVPATVSAATQTVTFDVNFEATHWVALRHDLRREDCAPDAATVRWTLRRMEKWPRKRSEVWAESSPGYAWGTGMELQGFDAPAGKYQLDLQYPEGLSCLKSASPRLLVNTFDLHNYQEAANGAAILMHYFAAVGGCFLPWALALWLRKRLARREETIPRIFPETVPRNCVRWMAHRPLPVLAGLPNFGLAWGAVLMVLVFIFIGLISPYPSKGLYVGLGRRHADFLAGSPWGPPLSVYLGAGETFHVNGKTVAKDQLGPRLEQELSHRAEWRFILKRITTP